MAADARGIAESWQDRPNKGGGTLSALLLPSSPWKLTEAGGRSVGCTGSHEQTALPLAACLCCASWDAWNKVYCILWNTSATQHNLFKLASGRRHITL